MSFAFRKLPMASARRLKQLCMVFPTKSTQWTASAMHLHMTSGHSQLAEQQNNGTFLASTFSDINSNLLTSEVKCSSFMEFYNQLPADKKGQFLCDLVQGFGYDKSTVLGCTQSVAKSVEKPEASFYSSADRLRTSLKPKFKTLFVHIGRIPGGVKFLVDLRADILIQKQASHSESQSAMYLELNSALKDLLMMWFTVGFLNLERITWNSSCDLVQKVSNYEAVHRIKTWEDIKRRVGPYRRCYIFTHNSMPREPVVVLHTALMPDIADNIHSVIHSSKYGHHSDFDHGENLTPPGSSSPAPPMTPTKRSPSPPSFSSISDTVPEDHAQIGAAVFYSITSTQKGLQGIDMGNYLIKSVVKKLQEEFPQLQQFSSLSPIPGFRDWLLSKVNQNINKRNAGEELDTPVLLPEEMATLSVYKLATQPSVLDFFKDQITSMEFSKDNNLAEAMRGPLMRLCAHYLYIQKRRNYALNPVANFHLSNGAQLWRINYLADQSYRGLSQSLTLMVNYRYFLDTTAHNSHQYLHHHTISVSQQVLDLLPHSDKSA